MNVSSWDLKKFKKLQASVIDVRENKSDVVNWKILNWFRHMERVNGR